MKSMIYDTRSSVQQLLDRGFEMPIHFVAVGTNGSVVGGTYRRKPDGDDLDCEITIPSTSAAGLTAPVNIMYVDRRGESAVVVLRKSPEEKAKADVVQ
ncbi:MAG TPA: hypothetical protein VGL72_08130 [Bryobacteraceae bacterium]|jgi:hypothetical protein